jgi:hypothetical protein
MLELQQRLMVAMHADMGAKLTAEEVMHVAGLIVALRRIAQARDPNKMKYQAIVALKTAGLR